MENISKTCELTDVCSRANAFEAGCIYLLQLVKHNLNELTVAEISKLT